MKNKHYITCTIIQNSNGEKFLSDLSDAVVEIQNEGLYAEVQYNNPIINTYSALVMSYRME